MCHLFGAVSSPSSSNYALKRTAVDNNNFYGVDASETVMKNFYVDDLQKLVESEVRNRPDQKSKQVCL